MKTLELSLMAFLAFNLAILTSCSKDEGEECHECHLALENADGSETMWEINSPSGGEFCGQELDDAESSSYKYIVSDTLYCSDGMCALPPGVYGPGSTDSIGAMYEIHCEEHGDH